MDISKHEEEEEEVPRAVAASTTAAKVSTFVSTAQSKKKTKGGRIPLVRRIGADEDALPWHGFLGDAAWKAPKVVAECKEEARPGYDTCSATEYLDDKETLSAKVAVLVAMLRASHATVAYLGAGISTAAGIGDYASKARGSKARRPKRGLNRKKAEPTQAHRVIAALADRKLVHEVVSQNHDCLSAKAGVPLSKLNQIHGSWFDTKRNPVLMMDDALRPDLLRRLTEWEARTQLTLSLGTSMCGMTSDCVATTVGNAVCDATAVGDPVGTPTTCDGKIGLVIINLQRTQHDACAALRIFAPIDTVMKQVARRLRLKVKTRTLTQSEWRK